MWAISPELEAEFDASTDRAAAIIGGGYVEERLLRALKGHLRRNEKTFSWLFHHSGPLASFEAKIKLGILVGLLTEEFAHDLSIIKDVRNRFAHQLDLRSFETDSIRDKLGNLTLLTININAYRAVEKREATVRQRYQFATGEAGGMLRERRGPSLMPDPPTYR